MTARRMTASRSFGVLTVGSAGRAGPNQGGNAARNRLLQLARGDWVQYLDADDYLRSTKLEQQLSVVIEYPDCDVICGPTAWERLYNGELVCTDETIPTPRDPWVLLAKWQLPQTGGPLWRRAALESVGGWLVGQPCCQEHELYLRLLAGERKFRFSEECLAVYCDSEDATRVTRKVPGEVDRQRLIIFDRIEQRSGRAEGINNCASSSNQRRPASACA